MSSSDRNLDAPVSGVPEIDRHPVREQVFHASTFAEAHDIGARIWYPHRLAPRVRAHDFAFRATSIDLGPVMLGTLHYSVPIRVDTAPYETSYELNVPLRGTVKTAVGDHNVEATPARAALYRYDVETAFSGFDRPSVMLAVKLDRHVVDSAVKRLFRLECDRLPTFETELDLSSGPGLAWITLARRIATATRRSEGLNPVLAGHLARRLIDDLVVMSVRTEASAASEASRDPHTPPAIGTSALAIAEDAIEHAQGCPMGLETIAALAGVSGRALQQAFQRAHGMSPMDFQLAVRLERVRGDLAAGVAGTDRVADVARRHGFAHLGRFAGQYARAFGERPGDTLRR